MINIRETKIIIFLIMFVISGLCIADEHDDTHTDSVFAVEYLVPLEDDRDIDTINLDYNSLISRYDEINLSVYYSLTGTYAYGHITRLEGSLEEGNLREVKLYNSAVGIGPGFVLSFKLFTQNRFSLLLNGSGSLILYNKKFPAGGDYYNFMWRAGPLLEYDLDATRSIALAYQFAHVSNGQGVATKNPSYEAHGVTLRFRGFF